MGVQQHQHVEQELSSNKDPLALTTAPGAQVVEGGALADTVQHRRGAPATGDQALPPHHHAAAISGIAGAGSSEEDDSELGHRRSAWRARARSCRALFCQVVCSPRGWPQRILCVLWWLFIIAILVLIFAVLLPKALARPIQQLLAFLHRSLTRTQIIWICFAAVVLLPMTIVLPHQPFIWVAGLALDFGRAFAIVMAASIVGMSIQYWLSRYLFKARAERYLERRKKDGISVALRAVDMAGPWKVVSLVRLGPSPYATCSYLFGACPTIKYHQFIIASTLCIAHHRALSVFFGRSMPTLADLFSGKPVTDVGSSVYRIVVLILGIILCVGIVIWAKRALKKLTDQELEREAAAEAAQAAEEGGAPLPAGADASVDAAAAPKAAAPGEHVILVDSTAAAASPGLPASSGSFASQVPPAAAGPSDSTVSRGWSVSSLQGLLGGRFQRSA